MCHIRVLGKGCLVHGRLLTCMVKEITVWVDAFQRDLLRVLNGITIPEFKRVESNLLITSALVGFAADFDLHVVGVSS